ncbi:hypothetical protein [Corallococcus exiguus]|uniref:hypothetical protein n=1 Tax=Corallococcus exiguus TaxID=83462 RepID=UPI001561A3BB|nr:hypothetical protein [Corallococcus exiguus]NRD54027.1 hypothetical protein [Corallococcus exiguus]
MSQTTPNASLPAPPLDSPTDSPPSKAAVLHLLDAEITLLSQQNLNSGWTSWALAGALGTLLWFLLGQWEIGWPKGQLWILSFIAINYCRLSTVFVFATFQARAPHRGSVTRFQLGPDLWGKQRASAVFWIIQHGVICWGLLKCSPPSFALWSGLVTSGVVVSVALMLFIFSYTEFPTSSADVGSGLKGFGLLLVQVVVSAFAVIPAVATGVALVELSPQLIEIKIGALLAAAVFLAEGALDSGTGRVVIDNLIRIRRELALGGLSPQEAARHVEIEFLGMRVPDVFRDAAQDFLQEAERIKGECLGLSRQVESALAGVRQDSSLTPVQKGDIVRAALNAHRQSVVGLVDEVKKLHGRLEVIQSKSRLFASASPDARVAVGVVLTTLNSGYGAAHSVFMALHESFTELVSRAVPLSL